MLKLLLPLLLTGVWIPVDELFVRQDRTHGAEIFINTNTGAGMTDFPEGKWTTLDIGEPEADAVFLQGLLIITHGSSGESCDLNVYARPEGSRSTKKLGQAVEPQMSGIRSGVSAWVHAPKGRFEFRWTRSTGGSYPAHCAYGVNLGVNAWMRAKAESGLGGDVNADGEINVLDAAIIRRQLAGMSVTP